MSKYFSLPRIRLHFGNYCFSPRWSFTLGTLILLSVFISLGFWQLTRAKEKETLQQHYNARTQQMPVSLQQLPANTDLRYYPVFIRGQYDNAHTILLDNKIHNQRLGYEVLTLFIPKQGARGILVDRGWVTANQNRERLPFIQDVVGQQQIEGTIYVPLGKPFTLGDNVEQRNKWPLRVESLDIAAFQAILKRPLYPFTVRLSPKASYGFLREWEIINMPPAKHLGYAFQWFTFALALFIIFIALNIKTTSNMRKNISKNPAWVLLCLILIFAIPLFLAWFMAAKHTPLGHTTTNHGELILPPLQLSKLPLSENKSINWKHHWLLLYVNPTNECNTQCEKTLYFLRQIQTAAGKDKNRVERAVLTLSDQALSHKTTFSDILSFTTSSHALSTFLKGNSSSKFALQTGGIYLVDPLGNVLMFYTLEANPMGIYKDIMRLLKISSIG